jgi:ribosomal protein S8
MRSVPGFITLISLVKDCQTKHRLSFSVPFRQIYTPFIRFLVELGIVIGFTIKNGRLLVYVRYSNIGLPVLQNIDKPALSDRRIAFKIKLAYPLSRPFDIIIISTTKGLLVYPAACYLRTGGRVLFKII